MDGSGKSTIAKKVSEKLKGTIIKTPTGIWSKYRHLVENAHPSIRFLYYTIANHAACLHIRQQLKKTHVVCDRFWHSTKAHHIVYGCRIAYFAPLWMLGNKRPDLVYYLSVSSLERERRILNRPGNKEKDIDSRSLKKAHRIFRKLPGIIEIDTTLLNEEEVVNIIIEDINNRFGRD